MGNLYVAEFSSLQTGSLEYVLNNFLEQYPDIYIIDIKYTIEGGIRYALMIYRDGVEIE